MADQSSSKDDSMTSDNNEFLPGFPTLDSYTQTCYKSLVDLVKKAQQLPRRDDYEYYNSFPAFSNYCRSQGRRMLRNIGKLLEFKHATSSGWPKTKEEQQNMDAEDLMESMIEANDYLLEEIDSYLDEASGIKKNKKPVLPASMQQSNCVVSSWNKNNTTKEEKVRFLHAKNILRPQLKFKDKPDNNNVPFVPIIKTKPNALRPLDNYNVGQHLDSDVPAALAGFIHAQRSQGSEIMLPHPYQFEIESFQPSDEAMSVHEPVDYQDINNTKLTYINTVEKLHDLLTVLKNVTEFAVDLEHHSFRSFQGFVCLMQISTRQQDYLIDTLELRGELAILNEVFTDTQILKVLHGADMDIGWLQRDFGIYVVNMFDTGQATRVLEYPRFALSFLLNKFCNVTANKKYQLADWRIRPLPREMEHYAREDTHYLLYIYDRLRNELISKGNEHNNLLESVYKRSKDVCLKVYEKPLFTNESYKILYQRHKKSLNRNQLEAFRLLYGWRDQIARLEDESYAYVLPNHMLFQIAEELPKAQEGVLACCNPVPSLVRQNINIIHRLIVQARDYITTSETSNQMLVKPVSNMDTSEPLNDNHAELTIADQNVILEPLVPFKGLIITGPTVMNTAPMIMLFSGEQESNTPNEREKKAKLIEESFKNPFQAFLPAPKRQTTKKTAEDINAEWKKASEERREAEEKEKKASQEKERKETGKDDNKRKHEEVNTENVDVPLREKKVKKKEKVQRNEQIKTGFKPFDYSKATFDRESGANDNTDIFNPYHKKLTEKNKQFSSKVNMKSGERSMSFANKK